MGAIATAAGVVALGIGGVWDDATDSIAIATGKTGDELASLQGSFANVFKSVPVGAGEASAAISELNSRLGLSGKPLEDLAARFLDLSRMTGTDVVANIEAVTRVFGDWGVAAENQSLVMDQLFKASQTTGVGIDQLSAQVVQFGAPLRQLGFGFEESIALLGKFEKEGVNTELVMGSMRVALGRMAREGEEPIETFRRVTEQIKNAGDAGTANALALELFGARAGPDMAAAIREGRFEIDELVGTIQNAGGAIDQAKTDTDGWRERVKLLQNQAVATVGPLADMAGITLTVGGSALMMASQAGPAFEAVSSGIGAARTALSGFSLSMGAAVTGGALLVAGLGAVYLIMQQFGDGSEEAAEEAQKLRDAQYLLNNSTLENIQSTRDQIAARLDEMKANGESKDAIERTKGSLDIYDAALAQVTESQNTQALSADGVTQASEEMAGQIDTTTEKSRAMDEVVRGLHATLDGMTSAAESAFGALDKFRSVPTQEQLELAGRISETNFQLAVLEERLIESTTAGDGNEESIRAQITALETEKERLEASDKVLETNRERTAAMGKAKLGASGEVDGLVASEQSLAFQAMLATEELSGQIGTADSLTGRLQTLALAAQAAFRTLSSIAFGGISVGANAEGTRNWRGGWSMVGERGPELINLPAGSDVYSNSDTLAMLSGGGVGPSIGVGGATYIANIYVTQPLGTAQEIARAILPGMVHLERTGGITPGVTRALA